MFRKTVAIWILVFALSGAYGQDAYEGMCRPTSAFSVDKVHRICSLGTDSATAAEVKWHKTEPYFVELVYHYRTRELAVMVSRFFNELNYRGRTISEFSPSFVQLEIAGDVAIVGTRAGGLKVWDILQETFLYEVQIAEGLVSELLAHPSEEWLLVAIDHERLYRFDLATRAVTEIELQADGDLSLDALAFSNDGRLLASGGSGVIRIWDTVSWELRAAADIGAASLGAVHFVAGDSQLIVLADAVVSRWSLTGKDLTLRRRLKRHPDSRPCRITVGDISPDETLLMTMDTCVQKRAWDLTTDREIYIPPVYSYDAFRGTVSLFSPDGRYYLSGGDYLAWNFKFVGPEE